jgi:DNA (cytosine-5)-methyltransferase 1
VGVFLRARLRLALRNAPGTPEILSFTLVKKTGRANGVETNLRSNRQPSFIDLFCGAGGFTWGWGRAGFTPLAAIDNDPAALRTHEANFGHTYCLTLHRDLDKVSPDELTELVGVAPGRMAVVVGGPPCQGWSKVGRGKLRSLGKAGDDLLADPRNTLYRRFIEMVAHCRPRICVMENVPGMLSVQRSNIADAVKANFETIGYACTYALVNAVWFGVPQDRNRIIFIATRRGTEASERDQG